MKIFVFSTTILYRDNISGGDVVLPQISKKWPAGKYALQVITSKEGQAVWESLEAEATFHLLPETVLDRSDSVLLGPIKYLVRTLQSLVLVNRLMGSEKEKFLIYTAPAFIPDTLPALIARKKFKQSRWLAWVYHVILPPRRRKGNFFFNLFSYLLQRAGLATLRRGADMVVGLGGTYKDLLGLGFPQERLQMSFAGVDKELLESAATVEEKYDGISVGTLTYTRGVYDLLDIWKLVTAKKPEACLAIVGGGSKRLMEEYRQKIKDMGLSENIYYYGFVPRNEDVYTILKSSKLHLCLRHEGRWSLTVAEAMAAGVPTVAYDLAMFDDVFKKGFVVVPTHAKEEFANRVIELLEDEGRRARLSKEALAESRNFDWQNIADKTGQIIEKLC